MRNKAEYPKAIKSGSVVVKVYRIAHKTTASGWVYSVAWVSAEGRKLQQFTDEAAVLQEAKLKADQLQAGRVEGGEMTRTDRDELQAARTITGQTPLLAALREWARINELTNGHGVTAAESWAARNLRSYERALVKDVVVRFLKEKTAAGIQTVKNHNHIFEDIKTEFGDLYIDTVSATQIGTFLAKRADPSTRNTFRKHVVGLWRWAQSQNHLNRDVKTEPEHTQRAKEPLPKKGIVDVLTLRNLLEFFRTHHPEYLAPLVIACFCGLRRSEVHAQIWDDIDLASRRLKVTKAKEGTPAERLVPIPRAGVAWLMLCEDRTGHLCANLAIDRIRDIAQGADFELPDNCFRHSFITYRCAVTQDIPQTAEESGNSPAIIRKHYKKLMTKTPAKLWFHSGPDEVGEVLALSQAS